MFYIAIIESNPILLESLCEAVRRESMDMDMRCEIGCFSSSDEFAAGTADKYVDLALIDISLTNGDGYAAAQAIRRVSLDTEIAFVASRLDNMLDTFDYKPIGFLEKPIDIKEIRRILNRFNSYHWHVEKYYTVHSKTGSMRVAHDDILYFESDNHNVKIHFSGGGGVEDTFFPGKLDDVEKELAKYPYVRCHKSFLVRMDAIDCLDRTKRTFILRNGLALPISKACYASATRRFLKKEE